MLLFLLRHCETTYNVEKRIQDPVKSKLSVRGKEQSDQIREYINKNNLQFNKIYCSNTFRTIQTLERIFPKYLDMKNVIIDSRLQERQHREIYGLTKRELIDKYNLEYEGRLSWQFYFEDTKYSTLTGLFSQNEKLSEVRERLISLVEEVKESDSNSKILLLGHGVINQYIVEYIDNKTIGEIKVGDFQKNNEIRIMKLNDNFDLENYQSVII